MSSNDLDRAANYGRAKDAACRVEAPDPTAAPRRPTSPSTSVAELEHALHVDKRPNPAAEAVRRGR